MRENSSELTGGQLLEVITKVPVMDLASVCSNNGTKSEETEGACDRKGLGISLSTPILMMSTGVLGNLLALLILFTAEKQVRRTSFFPLLMAMACSDLVGQAATGAIAVLVYANNLQWVGGRPVCLYHGFTMVFFAVITPLLVCSMSVERLLALRYSYFYQRCFTHGIARWVVVGSVAFTLFFCSWPLMGFGSYERQFPGSWCFLNYHRQSLKDMVYALVFSILNIAIIFFIVLCNVTVVYTLLKMRRLRHQMNAVPGKAGRKIMQAARQRSRSGLNLEMETQMVWFLLAITVVFSCLWLPINVHILMNQITGKVDYKQDLISVRLASINQIIDPWMYVIFRKTTFLKLLRRLRLFLTSRKKSTLSSLKHSHSCEDHRLKLLMPPRSQSCPPGVCYSVDGSVMPSDQLKDLLLPKDRFLGLAMSTRSSDQSLTKTTDTVRHSTNIGRTEPMETVEPSDGMEDSSDTRKEDLTKTKETAHTTDDKRNVTKEDAVKSSENLTTTEGNMVPLKANFKKAGSDINIECGMSSVNDTFARTNLTSGLIGNGGISSTRDATYLNRSLCDLRSNTRLVEEYCTITKRHLDTPHMPTGDKTNVHDNNKHQTCENANSGLVLATDYTDLQNDTNCFFQNGFRTSTKGNKHASRNVGCELEMKPITATDIEACVNGPTARDWSIANNCLELELLNQTEPIPEKLATLQTTVDHPCSCAIETDLGKRIGQRPPLPPNLRCSKEDNGCTPEVPLPRKPRVDRKTYVTNTNGSETTPLLFTNGSVRHFLPVDLFHCSKDLCMRETVKNGMRKEYSDRHKNGTVVETTQNCSRANAVFET